MARVLEDEVLLLGATGSTECYPQPGSEPVTWHCQVDGVVSGPGDQGLQIDVGYRPAVHSFVELDRSVPGPVLPFGTVMLTAATEAKPVQVRTRYYILRVSCAETPRATWKWRWR